MCEVCEKTLALITGEMGEEMKGPIESLSACTALAGENGLHPVAFRVGLEVGLKIAHEQPDLARRILVGFAYARQNTGHQQITDIQDMLASVVLMGTNDQFGREAPEKGE